MKPPLILFLLAAACGGTATSPSSPGASPSSPAGTTISAADAARAIVEGQSPQEVVAATERALAAGGVQVVDGTRVLLEARAPAASLKVDLSGAFNMAMEAHDRAVAGRYTVARLAGMWKAMGFPFAGRGSEGEQLLAFLSAWVAEADTRPGEAGSFTPLFLAEMARRQTPSFDLRAPASRPELARLSMLEVELITAAFDRALVRKGAPKATAVVSAGRQLDEGVCASFKGEMGELATVAQEQGIDHVLDFANENIRDAALEKLGLSTSAIEKVSGTIQKMFAALDAATKVAKLVQLYANTHVTLSVDGSSSPHARQIGEAQQIVSVTAHAGIPDSEWARYQQSSRGQGYQDLKSCLEYLGMPTPSELADLAKSLDKWRVEWRLRGPPPSDGYAWIAQGNKFDAPGTLAMWLARDGEASGSATLRVEVLQESHWGAVFGADQTVDYTVEAAVYTAEPPSPALLLKAMSFLGAVSALVELGAGFVQTLLPPTTTTVLHVAHHEAPQAIEASLQLDVEITETVKGQSVPIRMSGEWKSTLRYRDAYDPHGESYRDLSPSSFHYQSIVGADRLYAPCTATVQPRSGAVSGYVYFQEPKKDTFNLDLGAVPEGPHEDVSATCPGGGTSSLQEQHIFMGILVHGDNPLASAAAMSLEKWTRKPDGTLERIFDGPRAVQLPGFPLAVTREHSVFQLKPVFKQK